LTTDWNKYDCFHTVFKPTHMSAPALSVSFIIARIITFFLAWQTLPLGLLFIYAVHLAVKDYFF
jgi:hypothetical protein